MSNEQRNQQPSVPQQREQAPAPKDQARSEMVQKGAFAAIGGLCSGAARAILTHLLRDGS